MILAAGGGGIFGAGWERGGGEDFEREAPHGKSGRLSGGVNFLRKRSKQRAP